MNDCFITMEVKECNLAIFEYVSSFIAHSYNDDLSGIFMVIPNHKILSLYHEITKPIYAQISKNICENKELASLRDWLLPMLMNGQATVE